MNLQFLIDAIKQSPVLMKNTYPYFIFSLTDGALPIEPRFLNQIANCLCDVIENDISYHNIDYIIAPEAMGLPIATTVSDFLDKSYVVARKRKYGLLGELTIHQVTGYSESLMYINSVHPGENVIIVDDVVSTGGTLTAIINELKRNNINVLGSYTIIEKNGVNKELRKKGYNIKSLVNVNMGKDCIREVIESE